MKKELTLTMAALLVLAMAAPALAARMDKVMGESLMVIEGPIQQIDEGQERFVIRDMDDGKTYPLNEGYAEIEDFAEGDYVRVTVPRPGNFARKISHLGQEIYRVEEPAQTPDMEPTSQERTTEERTLEGRDFEDTTR